MRCAWLFAAVLALAPVGAPAAGLVNGGFETGDFTGWSLMDDPFRIVVTDYSHGPGVSYLPVEGRYLAGVGAKMFQTETNEGIFQEIDFDGHRMLRGSAALLSFADESFLVEGFVRLVRPGQSYTLFSASTADLGFAGGTPWTNFGVTPTAGHYRLEAFTLDHTSDAQQSAVLLLDAFSVTPEPGTWTLLISGFAFAGLGLRASRRGRIDPGTPALAKPGLRSAHV